LRDRRILGGIGVGLVVAVAIAISLTGASAAPQSTAATTPIKHLVVIFDENISFDHYFGTYPNAANPPGEPAFYPKPGTPSVNGLNNTLLTDNPNEDNPQRLDRSVAITCDQDHNYSPEQEAFDGGLMDKFVQFTAGGGCTGTTPGESPSTVMDYYDGNTVTALWNYAQNYSLNDESFGTGFGPSTPGALNLISGNTGGASPAIAGKVENGAIINDADPTYDDCSSGTTVSMSGQNVGNLLNSHGVTWGWFQGGFTPTGTTSTGAAVCGTAHTNVGGASVADYVQHHEPFQYYASTANPHHLPPSSVANVGFTDAANHQYDLSYFNAALAAGNLPSVSFLKAPAYEDGHAGYSDPLDEQRFLVDEINAVEESPDWGSTAIVIAYDDSDGWYDHVMSPIVRPSDGPSDALSGPGKCGNVPASPPPTFQNDQCGYGPRLPLLVISPWAKSNFVDNTITDQSSILAFIENNWQLGRLPGSSDAIAGSLGNMFDFSPNGPRAPRLILDDTTGEVVSTSPSDVGSPGSTTTTSSTSSSTTSSKTTSTSSTTTSSVSPSNSTTTTHSSTTTGGPTVTTTSSHSTTTTSTSTSTTSTKTGGGSGGKPAPKAITCVVTRKGHSTLVITCTVGKPPKGTAALRVRIERGTRVLSTGRSLLHGARAKVTLHTSKQLKGGYTLRLAVTSAAGVSGYSRTLQLG